MFISSQFDGGNIDVLTCERPYNIQVAIRKDNQSDFYQWFYFRLTGAEGEACKIHITNAGKAAYPDGFKSYQAVASYDRTHWFRVDTQFDGEQLVIEHTPATNSIYFAYFAPYSMERHADLIAWASADTRVEYERLGSTLDGRDMDLLIVGEPAAGKKACWIIGRQHPGETMAEWCIEGFLDRLLDEDDPAARELLERAVVYVVPNMNPDGSARGHLRTNAVGSNLNREWQTPSLEKSPEVLCVLEKMHQAGVDFCLDVHGDEALPFNFIAGAEGIPGWNDEKQRQLDFYKQTLMTLNPDFQIEQGYEVDKPGSANLTICTNFIAHTFGCLAMTLEMPFKDTADSPQSHEGWSPARSRHLGASNLQTLLSYLKAF
ncbi:M14 family metallopeptidase [Simiduia agarivorans]|uniref:Peptidase M14, carboxypeptidase A n=1 Tax=Simiduia agarivorans (strain DSM 21679 / JCM 13881 / BCRC 17597 / SA1) TaxID=1117647 RepID=K4KGU0_SIMAS|nr:M14-type cytosolic carboxypeptidase [Simiduia agarivorans]AFU98206.1 peptidase M14, carboxypeptidase A [Simiduia agarivorans SA1 = DSM 21679]